MRLLFFAILTCAAAGFAQGLAPSQVDLHWLQLNFHNKPGDARLRPELTVIITSARPTINQIREGCWEISFSSKK
jgi:hypothetical protein